MPAEQRLTWRRRLFAFVVASVGAAAAPGQPIDTGRWTITFHDARSGTIPPTGFKPSTPKTLVMVEVDLDNRSATTSNVYSRVFTIEPPIPNLPPPTFYLARDKSVAG